jgi:hypothetical protein
MVAPPAEAATTFRFHAGVDRARVSASDPRAAEHGYVELVRGGMVIARSLERNGVGAAGGHVTVPSLVAGDVVNAYGNGALIATATYDGLPTVAGAFRGRSSFTVTRAESARTTWVGLEPPRQRLLWEDARVFTVGSDRALALGQTASAITTASAGDVDVVSRRDVRVERSAAPAHVPPTRAELRRAMRRSVRAACAALSRARLGRRVTVAFSFLEPGSVQLELKAGGEVVGSGVETAARAGRGRVTVALSRRARGRLMLTATFVPARAGARPQSASARFRT